MIGRRRLDRYIFRGPEELFDLDKDPEEVNNLVNKPEFEDVLKEMRAKVEKWQYLTEDIWLFKDGVSAMTTEGGQRLGLKLPNRFDFDVKAPGNANVSHWMPPCEKSRSTMIEYG